MYFYGQEIAIDVRRTLNRIERTIMRIGINAAFRRYTACGQGKYLLNLLRSLEEFENTIKVTELHPDWSNVGTVGKPLSEARWEVLGLRHDARAAKVDVIHNPYWTAPLPIPTSPPVVVTIHDVVPLLSGKEYEVYRGGVKSVVYYRAIQVLSSFAKLIIADSCAAADDIARVIRVPTSKIRVVPLAAEEYFSKCTTAEERQLVLSGLGIEPPYALYVASGLDMRKNILRLSEAFEAVLDQTAIPMRLVIVGDLQNLEYPASTTTRDLVTDDKLANSTIFTGYVRDDLLPSLYQAAEFCVLPSLYEGGALVLLEAMASGKAVVASDIASLHELSGGAAEFVDPRSVADIARGITRLMVDIPYREDVAGRAAEFSRRYSWENVARQTAEVYRDAAN